MPSDEVPVVVVGAGPAGLAAAISLARLGVETMLVERRPELSSLPRATAVSLRSMELMRVLGRGGRGPRRRRRRRVARLAVARRWPRSPRARCGPSACPTREQAAVLSPTAPACVPQDHLEPVLLEHLRSLGAARVQLHTEVVGVENRPDGVEVALRDVATGDAAHRPRPLPHRRRRRTQPVRRRSASPCTDPTGSPTSSMRSSARRCGASSASTATASTPSTHPDGAGIVPARGPRRPLGLRHVGGPRGRRATTRRSGSCGAIRAGAGIADLDVAIERIGAFSFAAQLADRFRDGNVFLAGDAAHRVTPRGGTGMNTAIRGGHDLGWKLGWVLRGWAGPELLDTYEAERRPIAAHNVARSADPNGSTRETSPTSCTSTSAGASRTCGSPPPGRVSTLDLLGPGLTLFTGPDSSASEAPAHGGPPVAVRRLDAVSARAMGIRGRAALLVRPDGTPARLWTQEATAAA